ncbi:hypothetical protein OGAPHI_004465 [Ogataea philodendri]|uniref:Uncharacterized protein n=1 Tax=Ogataea philodendri TaxID=1378263 RepID=A0A9P8T5T9_9ASCO|nr:uncharacterized protein OGAPHI_004465 [Ogataea philodendri]KAH3666276.1 hypothetical protein OGAPHI_004465 [Ogataea philodendri]
MSTEPAVQTQRDSVDVSGGRTAPYVGVHTEHHNRGSLDHRRKSSSGEPFKSGRFSWVKRLMNNNKPVPSTLVQGPSRNQRPVQQTRQETASVHGTKSLDDQRSTFSTDNSTIDNVSTRPILSNSSDESENEADEVDSSYKYYDPSVKSTAMTSIAPTSFTTASSYGPNNMLINPGGSSGAGSTTGAGTSVSNYSGTATPTGQSSAHQTAHGADSSSVITIASSTRNRRRRSIDTNASISAIPPASIFERIVPANASGHRIPVTEIPSRAAVSEQDSLVSTDYCSVASQ